MTKQIEICCQGMETAVKEGVLNEGLELWIGDTAEPFQYTVKYCPWCGKKVVLG